MVWGLDTRFSLCVWGWMLDFFLAHAIEGASPLRSEFRNDAEFSVGGFVDRGLDLTGLGGRERLGGFYFEF